MEKTKASTQDHLDIYDIREDLVIYKSGAAAAVIETGAINFELLSQREQDAAIMAYSGLLNSLTFPIQVVIKSKLMNISDYLKKIETAQSAIKGDLLKDMAGEYKNFVENLVENFSILDKKFFVSVSFNKNLILPSSSAFGWAKELFGIQSKSQGKINTGEIIQKAKVDIEPRVEHIIREFKRININAKRLETEELIKLFYESYNPESNMGNQVKEGLKEYTTPLVESL